MKTFVRVENEKVGEILHIEKLPEFHPDLDWRDATGVNGIAEGWIATDKAFSAPPPPAPPTDEQCMLFARYQRGRMLAEATLAIAPLQDAIDLEEATPAEIVLLKKWKQYRVAVNRVEDQSGWPRDLIWPEKPTIGVAQ